MKKLFAGVDLGGTSMIAVIANSKGKVLGSSDCATLAGVEPAVVIDQVAAQLLNAAREAGVDWDDVRAVGIGAPGAVDRESGVVAKAPNLGWIDVPLGEVLSSKVKKDVVVGNDVQVAIRGEHAYGAARGAKRAVGIWVGTGVGGGLIIDGKIDRGSRGAAGEIGHVLVKEDGPLCGCGRTGCVEAVASRTAMERDVREAIAKGRESVVPSIMLERQKTRMTSSVMKRALAEKDPVMAEVLANAQKYLGILAGNIVNVLDPEMIVIGGGVAQRLKEDFVAPIREVARSRYLRPDPEGKIRIEHSILGDFSGALGASAMAREA